MEYRKDSLTNRDQGPYIILAASGKENLHMGHGFILPVQFGIEDGTGINLQCADQRKNNLPGWISNAVFNMHDRSDFNANLFSQLALCITKAESRILYDTA